LIHGCCWFFCPWWTDDMYPLILTTGTHNPPLAGCIAIGEGQVHLWRRWGYDRQGEHSCGVSSGGATCTHPCQLGFLANQCKSLLYIAHKRIWHIPAKNKWIWHQSLK
jgi:hypothetical protein